jgi:hypothetical protein
VIPANNLAIRVRGFETATHAGAPVVRDVNVAWPGIGFVANSTLGHHDERVRDTLKIMADATGEQPNDLVRHSTSRFAFDEVEHVMVDVSAEAIRLGGEGDEITVLVRTRSHERRGRLPFRFNREVCHVPEPILESYR